MSTPALDCLEQQHQEQSLPDRQRIQRTLLSGEAFAGITREMPAQRRLLPYFSQLVGKSIAPALFPRENVVMRRLTEVIWRYRPPVGAFATPDDVVKLESDDTIGLPVGASLYETVGISAEPRALNGHILIVGPWMEGDAIRALEGRVDIAVCEGEDDSEDHYLKRIQFEAEAAWLVNLNRDALPVRVCLGPAFLPRLAYLARLVWFLNADQDEKVVLRRVRQSLMTTSNQKWSWGTSAFRQQLDLLIGSERPVPACQLLQRRAMSNQRVPPPLISLPSEFCSFVASSS